MLKGAEVTACSHKCSLCGVGSTRRGTNRHIILSDISGGGRAGYVWFFFFNGSGPPRDLPSSPTRRSPDLPAGGSPTRRSPPASPCATTPRGRRPPPAPGSRRQD